MAILIQTSTGSHPLDTLSYMRLFQTSKKSKIGSNLTPSVMVGIITLPLQVIIFQSLVVDETF